MKNSMRLGARAAGFLAVLGVLLLPAAGLAGEDEKSQVPKDKAAIAGKVRQLGDNSWKVREEAQRDLVSAGEAAVEELEKALKSEDAEIRQRAESALQAIRKDMREGASQAAAKARLWTSPVKEGVASPAARAGGIVCFLAFDGSLRAVDANTGKALWTFEELVKESDVKNVNRMVASMPTLPVPLIADGLVFVSAQFGRAYAIDLANGQVQWKSASADGFAPPAVSGGQVFLGGTEKDLRALDIATGKETWRADLESGCSARSVVIGQTVYAAGRDNTLYGFNVKNGQRRTVASDLTDISDLLATAGGDLVARTFEGLLCLDPADGKQKWTFPLPQDPMQARNAAVLIAARRANTKPPARPVGEESVVAAGDVLYTTAGGAVHAVEAATGKLLWTFKPQIQGDDENVAPNGVVMVRQGAIVLGGQGRFIMRSTGTGMLSNPCVAGEMMYVASPMGLHAVELKARQEIWRLETKGLVAARPVAIDGVLYYGTSDVAGMGAAGVAMVFAGNAPAFIEKAQPDQAEQPADSAIGLNALKLKTVAAAK